MSSDPIKILVIGDPHFKVSNVRDTDSMVDAICSIALSKPLDIIVVLGDVLDRHEVIHVSPLTRSIKFLSRLQLIAPTYVMMGNHDLRNWREFLSDEHPFTSLKFWGPSMTVVDTTTLISIRGQTLVFVPYVAPGRYVEALNFCPGWQSASCIFGHQEIRGAHMGPIISTEGDLWPLSNPFTVLGHIHDYHELQPNVLYVGTPIQQSFGDRHDKTISYFTIFSPSSRLHDRIDLCLPRKHILRINSSDVSSYILPSSGDFRIIISGTSAQLKAIITHPSIHSWTLSGHKIIYRDIPLDKPDLSIDRSSSPLPRFSSLLYTSVSSNSRLIPLFTLIFGPPKLNFIDRLSLKILLPPPISLPSPSLLSIYPSIKLSLSPHLILS